MRGIWKYFPSTDVQANRNVDFSAHAGSIHAIVGENGAGKTTLMNILYGLHRPDRGEILVDGEAVEFSSPADAIGKGIGMVHQHFKLVPTFTVTQNILLGMEPQAAGFLNPGKEERLVRGLMDAYGLPVDPKARIDDLPVGMQQRVEILKSLQRNTRILLLDEPTAVLTPQEVRELFGVLRRLSEEGRTIILITHKLPEVMALADTVTVMCGGEVRARMPVADTNLEELAGHMVGRKVVFRVEKGPCRPGNPVAEVSGLVVAGTGGAQAVSGVSFTVRRGEIVGIAGVNGNGQSELAEALSGTRPVELGEIRLLGEDITGDSVARRRNDGIACIPEDRMHTGLNLETTLDENVVVTRYRGSEFSRFLMMKSGAISRLARKIADDFDIRAAVPGEGIASLSGGNLQKIVLGRELQGNPAFIIANQPTRGLDVGSIEFVHGKLIEARDGGAGILLISVELEEILSLSDRILVMYGGTIAGEMEAGRANEENLGILMAGGSLAGAVSGAGVSTGGNPAAGGGGRKG